MSCQKILPLRLLISAKKRLLDMGMIAKVFPLDNRVLWNSISSNFFMGKFSGEARKAPVLTRLDKFLV
jgi:hypothetical protein